MQISQDFSPNTARKNPSNTTEERKRYTLVHIKSTNGTPANPRCVQQQVAVLPKRGKELPSQIHVHLQKRGNENPHVWSQSTQSRTGYSV